MARAVKQIVRKYYKYQTVIEPFTQPVLSSNGILHGGSFAVYSTYTDGNQPYRLFDNNSSTYYSSYEKSSQVTVTFYNPNPICVTTMAIHFLDDRYRDNQTIFGSNDYSTWTQITYTQSKSSSVDTRTLLNTNYYMYYKIVTPYWWDAWSIVLTATQKTTDIVEGTSSDYDFYEDVNTYKVPVINNTYYGVNQ